jgi:hypothetical protein
VAILLRLVQQFDASRKEQFMDLERQFSEVEKQGHWPRGERFTPISARDPGNTLIWQCRFENLAAAEAALKAIEQSPEHTGLVNQQMQYFKDTWIEFYQVLD